MTFESFGLSEDPFGIFPDRRFFYESESFRRTYSELADAVRGDAASFVLLTGAAGVGKTTLLGRLANELRSAGWSVVFWRSVPAIGGRSTYSAESKEILSESSATARALIMRPHADAIKGMPVSDVAQGRSVLVLIDDADGASDSALQGVCKFASGKESAAAPFCILAAGTPVLAERLQCLTEQSALRGAVALIHLEALRPSEVGPYIRYRLEASNYRGTDLFNDEVVERIGAYATGVPRQINRLCVSAMVLASIEPDMRISAGIVDEAAVDCLLTEPTARLKPTRQRSVIASLPMADRQTERAPAAGRVSALAVGVIEAAGRGGLVPAKADVHGPLPMIHIKVSEATNPRQGRFRPIMRLAGATAAVVAIGAIGLLALDAQKREGAGSLTSPRPSPFEGPISTVMIAGDRLKMAASMAPERARDADHPPSGPGESSAHVAVTLKEAPTVGSTSDSAPASVPRDGNPARIPDRKEPLEEAAVVVAQGTDDKGVSSSAETAPVKPSLNQENPASSELTPAAPPAERAPLPGPSIDVNTLLSRGDQHFRLGDAVSARLFYQLAARQGSGQAATRLAQTYDPAFLEEPVLRGVRPDRAAALEWYRKAVSLGDNDASFQLNGLLARLSQDAAAGDPEAKRILQTAR